MIRRPLAFALLAIILCGSSSMRMAQSAGQEPCAQDRTVWVAHALIKMETIKPGMTRQDLLEVFAKEGGLSTGLQRTFASQDCPYFKVDVTFNAIARPNRDADGRVTLVEDNRDIIAKISRPYLQFGVLD